MSAVDFDEWAAPGLTLTFGGRTFAVRPPSVDDAPVVIAAAVSYEIRSGFVEAEMPEGMQALLDALGPDDHPSLGDAHAELVAAGVDGETLQRMTAYATFYWARGKKYADEMAVFLWSPEKAKLEDAASLPKARLRDRLRSGRRMASASRTRTAGSPTTGPSPTI